MSDVLMRADTLSLAAGGRLLQTGITLNIHAGEVLVVAGASGCGKSTLLRHLVGLQTPPEGQVWLATPEGEVNLHALAPGDPRLSRSLGVAFQGGALFSSMSVGENVMLPLQMFGDLSEADGEAKAREKLALAGLAPEAFDLMPAALSGGMKKRAAIARALALDPPLLFLDEPSAGLDPLAAARLDELITRLAGEGGHAIVLVSHELESIFAVGHRLLFLDVDAGHPTALGPPRELLASGPPAVREFLARGRPSTHSPNPP
jgi:phospholipid/cholesterol/gamma-HCH transport system ATP-binding protein